MKVLEQGYIILSYFADTSGNDLSWDVNLPFDVVNDSELEGRTQLAFFQSVL